jgi:hypothetical protein
MRWRLRRCSGKAHRPKPADCWPKQFPLPIQLPHDTKQKPKTQWLKIPQKVLNSAFSYYIFIEQAQKNSILCCVKMCRVKRYSSKTRTVGTSFLNPVEVEVIQTFARYFCALGQSRSIGRSCGLPIVSRLSLIPGFERPEETIGFEQQLNQSGFEIDSRAGCGAAAGGFQPAAHALRGRGELRNLAGSFPRQPVSTHLSGSEVRLKRIARQAQSLKGEARKYAINHFVIMKFVEGMGT